MSDFDPSPRSSKRRKVATYASDTSTPTSPSLESPSVLRSLSTAVSGISRRLFEPRVTQGTAAPASDGANGPGDTAGSRKSVLQKANQVEAEQEFQEVDEASKRIERSGTNKNGTDGQGDVTDVRKTENSNPSRKGSKGIDKSQRSHSVRRSRAAEETPALLVKASLENMQKNSSNARRFVNDVDLQDRAAEVRNDPKTPRMSSKERPAALASQGGTSSLIATSCPVPEESTPENNTKGNQDGVVTGQRSSGREKRRPRRYSDDMVEHYRKQPVGILDPSKRNRTGARKSVAFEDEEQQLEPLNFKDIRQHDHGTDNVNGKKDARCSHHKAVKEYEPSGISSGAVPAGDGDEQEEDELEVENTAMPDLLPVLNVPSKIVPACDSFPGAEEDPYLAAIKSKVISRLTNSSLVPLSNVATEYAKIQSLLKATITAGEGNSMLVLGARGSGKTNLIETALSDVGREHAEDFHVVRLNGFQQTDDRIALREIWRQLGREMQVDEDETNQVSSYADTMASLLYLLSHPEELVEVLETDVPPARTTKSVIFVLDEFDLFATHPRQTLLYNLFDIAQAKKAPIAVIGCSTRVDVTESLEKRVKSRFSHRWVYLSQPKNFQAFEAVVKATLCVSKENDEVLKDLDSSRCDAWNEYMQSIFIPSSPVQALLKQVFYTTKSIPSVFSSLYIPVASITSLDPPTMPTSLTSLTPPDSPLQLLPSLPPLHLYLLISAARLDAIHNATVVNFNLVYHHYVELASRSRLQSSALGALAQGGITKIWGKDIAKAAWEELADWEIVVPAALGKGRGDDAPDTKMCKVDVTLEEVAACVSNVGAGTSEVLAKWCKEV